MLTGFLSWIMSDIFHSLALPPPHYVLAFVFVCMVLMNFWFSCVSLLSPGISGLNHHIVLDLCIPCSGNRRWAKMKNECVWIPILVLVVFFGGGFCSSLRCPCSHSASALIWIPWNDRAPFNGHTQTLTWLSTWDQRFLLGPVMGAQACRSQYLKGWDRRISSLRSA